MDSPQDFDSEIAALTLQHEDIINLMFSQNETPDSISALFAFEMEIQESIERLENMRLAYSDVRLANADNTPNDVRAGERV